MVFEMNKAIIFDIQRNSFVDGPGIRTTVFFKGCNLKCAWCHNPESQSAKPQMMFYKDKCTGCGKCKSVCPYHLEQCELCGKCTLYCPVDARKVCGKEHTVDEVLKEVLKDKAFYETSGGGVTFSGGECMLQIDFLVEILKKCKENGIHTAVDTAGHIPFESFEKILPYTDLFLYDIKIFDSQKHKQYVGVSNELILENLKKLFERKAKLWIRIPIIPDVNDSIEEIQKIKDFLKTIGTAEKIELLPYHAMGENKYRAIGKEPQIFKTPDAENMKRLKEILPAFLQTSCFSCLIWR
jgi:pyruvate formate lyase activating enzyme